MFACVWREGEGFLKIKISPKMSQLKQQQKKLTSNGGTLGCSTFFSSINSNFDSDSVRQFKARSFLGPLSLVELSINQTKSKNKLCSINVLFDLLSLSLSLSIYLYNNCVVAKLGTASTGKFINS